MNTNTEELREMVDEMIQEANRKKVAYDHHQLKLNKWLKEKKVRAA